MSNMSNTDHSISPRGEHLQRNVFTECGHLSFRTYAVLPTYIRIACGIADQKKSLWISSWGPSKLDFRTYVILGRQHGDMDKKHGHAARTCCNWKKYFLVGMVSSEYRWFNFAGHSNCSSGTAVAAYHIGKDCSSVDIKLRTWSCVL
jgi:hypothetical protein